MYDTSERCNVIAITSKDQIQNYTCTYTHITCFPVHNCCGLKMAGGSSLIRPCLSVRPLYTNSVYWALVKKQPLKVILVPDTMWSWISPAKGLPSCWGEGGGRYVNHPKMTYLITEVKNSNAVPLELDRPSLFAIHLFPVTCFRGGQRVRQVQQSQKALPGCYWLYIWTQTWVLSHLCCCSTTTSKPRLASG